MPEPTIEEKIAAQQRAAEDALAAANAARDGAEAQFLLSVTNTRQLSEGRTVFESNRLKSRLISLAGFDHWQKLVSRSR